MMRMNRFIFAARSQFCEPCQPRVCAAETFPAVPIFWHKNGGLLQPP